MEKAGFASTDSEYDEDHADGVWREVPEDEVMPHVAEAFAHGVVSDALNVTTCPHEGWLHYTWEGTLCRYYFCRRLDGKWFVAVERI